MKKDVVSKVWQLIFLLALSIPMSGFAQAIQVKGTVLDASGMTVIGASVLEKGTTNGVITDMDGNFELSVSPKGTLVISYVGFQTQEIAVNNQRNFKITLKEDTEVLDEVVVVGYGTMKKSDMTGAISSVDVDELTKRTTTNPAEALQGKIAGVNIMKSGGNAGAGVSVKIRGVKSFGDNEPLYIIDGFPGDINSVNPVDIQSMEVLKDGAAAAIYGSVAANGVVIITTKNGKKGETHIDFNTYLSMTTVAKRMEFLNAEQYKSTIKQMYINAGREDEIPAYCTTDTGVDTNWQDEMMRNGLSQNYMFSVRGGGETAQYSVSYNHADDKGIFLGNDFRQDNARMKLHMSKYIFDLDANLGFRYTKSHQPTYSLKEVYNISPLVPVYDENEKYGFGLTASQGLPSNNNPMADYYYQDETEKTFSTTANVSLGIKITSWLNFKTSYAYRGKHYRYTLHYPDYISNAQQTHLYPYNSESTYYWEEQTIDNILNFNKEFGKHSLNAMIGSSITSTKNTSNGVAVEGFATRYTVDKNGNLVSTNEPSGFLDPSFDICIQHLINRRNNNLVTEYASSHVVKTQLRTRYIFVRCKKIGTSAVKFHIILFMCIIKCKNIFKSRSAEIVYIHISIFFSRCREISISRTIQSIFCLTDYRSFLISDIKSFVKRTFISTAKNSYVISVILYIFYLYILVNVIIFIYRNDFTRINNVFVYIIIAFHCTV